MADVSTDQVIMQSIATIAPGYPVANTRLAQLGGKVVVENEYTIGTGNFPALHIESMAQKHQVVSRNVYDGTLKVELCYFDRWDTQPNTVDNIRKQINADLQTIMTNLQVNSSLVVDQTPHAVSIPIMELSPYRGELDWRTVPGLTLVKRCLTLTINILPYDVP